RRTARSESGSVPTTSTPTSLPSTNDARTPEVPLATTCAEVSMKPSGVTTTPLPPPSRRRPPRTRRETRRLATEGERRSATVVTAREYASSTSSSAGTSCDEMNVRSTAPRYLREGGLPSGRGRDAAGRRRDDDHAQPARCSERVRPGDAGRLPGGAQGGGRSRGARGRPHRSGSRLLRRARP